IKDFHPAQSEVQMFWIALGTGNPDSIGGVKAEGDNGEQDVDEFDGGEEREHRNFLSSSKWSHLLSDKATLFHNTAPLNNTVILTDKGEFVKGEENIPLR